MFSASYSGLFKTFFDVLEEGTLDGKPVLVAATAGTARHSLVLEHALRPLFAYLHAVVVPDRCLRGHRGLRQRQRAGHPDRTGRRRAVRSARRQHPGLRSPRSTPPR